MRLSELQNRLEDNNPGFANSILEIIATLKEYPEQVAVLSEDQIGLIVSGALRRANIQIATGAKKKPSLKNAKPEDF
jgi:hypothetical protein